MSPRRIEVSKSVPQLVSGADASKYSPSDCSQNEHVPDDLRPRTCSGLKLASTRGSSAAILAAKHPGANNSPNPSEVGITWPYGIRPVIMRPVAPAARLSTEAPRLKVRV